MNANSAIYLFVPLDKYVLYLYSRGYPFSE